MAAVPVMLANQVTVEGAPGGYGPYQTGGGGEFTFKPDAGLSYVLNSYEGLAKNQGVSGTFQSFCVEDREIIYPNTTLNVVLNDHSVYSGQTLSVGAAWLYAQFATGQLAGYDHSAAKIGDLQNSIWMLMHENIDSRNAVYNHTYYDLAVSTFGSSGVFAADNGAHHVAVMNLWDGTPNTQGNQRQDMLIYGVPDGGTTCALLGMALTGLGLARRKML